MANQYKPEGTLILTHENREWLMSRQSLEKAVERQVILEAVPTLCDRDFRLHFDLGSIHGIMPREETQYCRHGEEIKDIAVLTRVGKPVCFKIIGFEQNEAGETYAVLSRKAAQSECMQAFISTLVPGDILRSHVTHIENFGVFVDIGCGIVSLMSIDTISVSRISHPKERLSVGDQIYTVVRSIDSFGRICTSMRELLGTWEENASLFSPGQTVAGIVRSIESYGIFVELTTNLAGLAELRDGVSVNQAAAVYIKSIVPERMKIKLVIIDTHDRISPPPPPKYFIDCERTQHIDYWRYSPICATKLIETYF